MRINIKKELFFDKFYKFYKFIPKEIFNFTVLNPHGAICKDARMGGTLHNVKTSHNVLFIGIFESEKHKLSVKKNCNSNTIGMLKLYPRVKGLITLRHIVGHMRHRT